MSARPHPTEWPALPYEDWTETRRSLHLITQVVGKVRLALSPARPQWLGAPLYPNARGLTTGRMPWGTDSVEISLDFVDHRIVVQASDGWTRSIPLTPPRCVADIHAEVVRALADLGLEIELWARPQAVADLTPLDQNRHDCAYDTGAVRSFFKVLTGTANLFDEWQSGFFGRTSLQFWWGTFDLSTARFTGARATPPEGVGYIMRWDLDAEHYSAGWWPGDDDFGEAAFYAYAHPMPEGLERAAINPAVSRWNPELGEWILPYEDARATGDVRGAVLEFLESTWQAVGSASGWDLDALRYDPPPPGRQSGEHS